MSKFLQTLPISLLGLSFLLASCGPVDDRVEITQERELPPGHKIPPLGNSLRERMLPMAKMSEPVVPQPQAVGGADLASMFQWDTPEGWEQAPATAMRLVNMRFGENGAGECYLTVLMGGGGGLEANIGRWYGQMGKKVPTADEVAVLPRAPLMGREAVVIDIEGPFTGMGSTVKDDYRLIGRILPQQSTGQSQFTMFLKLTGPAQLVADNLEKFEQFTQSLAPRRPDVPE